MTWRSTGIWWMFTRDWVLLRKALARNPRFDVLHAPGLVTPTLASTARGGAIGRAGQDAPV